MLLTLALAAMAAFGTPPPAQDERGIFQNIRSLPAAERIMAARNIYKANLRRADSVSAFQGLASLRTMAIQLGDKPLECSVLDLQADYFSVNRGFNPFSLKYYNDAIRLARSYDLPVYAAVHTYKLGTFYNTFGMYAQANGYFIEALDQVRAVGYDKVPRIGIYLLDMSNFYYKVGDMKTSGELAREALRWNDPREDQELSMMNTIALTSQGLGDEAAALEAFSKALHVAGEKRDTIWIAIISSNIGAIYYRRGEYDRARPLLETGYRESLRFGDLGIALGSILLLANNHMATGEMKEAGTDLAIADDLVSKVNRINRWSDYYNAKARWYELRHEPGKALEAWRAYDVAKDSLEKVNNIAEVERVKWRWEMDKHQADIGKMQARARTEMLTRNFIIAVLFLLMVISILIYNRRLVAKKNAFDLLTKEEELVKSERDRAEEALRHATSSLTFFTESLRDKNVIIEEFRTEIERLHKQVGQAPDELRLQQLDQLIQSHIMTDEAWREFQRMFDRVHYGFIVRLRNKFEAITETDIRLLALIKLGLNNREMSNVLGVTTEAIKKSRQRLRKKIELPEEESLEQVVAGI
jgi:tetratricopeptide (TPR) repeat protein